MKQIKTTFLFLAPFMLAIAGGAQAQSNLQNQLNRCAEIDNVLERLACYDDLSNANNARSPATTQKQAPAPSPPVVVRPQSARPVAEATPESAESVGENSVGENIEEEAIDTFGQEAVTEQARIETSESGDTELVDMVSEVKPLDPTRVLITLSNGQIWRQTVGKRYMLRKGDKVHISPSGWGNDYRLSAEGKRGYIQVSRAL